MKAVTYHGQAEFLRVPQAHFGPIKVPEGPPDERFVYLSDVLPTAWQAVEYAAVPPGGSAVVFGLGPIGQMCARIALHRGAGLVIGVRMDLFDKQIQLRMGQANVKRWIDELMPLVQDDSDPLGVHDLATHKVPLDEAPHAYEIFQKKEDGAIKIFLQP